MMACTRMHDGLHGVWGGHGVTRMHDGLLCLLTVGEDRVEDLEVEIGLRMFTLALATNLRGGGAEEAQLLDLVGALALHAQLVHDRELGAKDLHLVPIGRLAVLQLRRRRPERDRPSGRTSG